MTGCRGQNSSSTYLAHFCSPFSLSHLPTLLTTSLSIPIPSPRCFQLLHFRFLLLDAAVDDGLILLSPAKKTRTVNPPRSCQIRAQKPEIVTWTGPQLQAFLTWNRDVLDDELFPLWRTLAYTGMRRSEAHALRWSDINFTTGRVSIRRAVDVTLPNTTKVTKTGTAPESSTSMTRSCASSRPTRPIAARSHSIWPAGTPMSSETTTGPSGSRTP